MATGQNDAGGGGEGTRGAKGKKQETVCGWREQEGDGERANALAKERKERYERLFQGVRLMAVGQ